LETSRITRCGETRSNRVLVLGGSTRERHMHHRLFGPDVKRVGPVSDTQMRRVLRELRATAELKPFRLWLVGSRVQPGNTGSDIDVVLSPRAGVPPDEHLIERALWHCREYGLYGANRACVIDPCFRTAGPTLHLIPLQPRVLIKTVKLFSPRLVRLLTLGRLSACRSVGEVCIEFVRTAEDTDYYRKLPRRVFGGSQCPYQRPAIEIPCSARS
jgi:hypothetical protein